MKNWIQHPCPACQDPTRACGHTKQDVRAYHERLRAERREKRLAQTSAPRYKWHRVKPEGAEVFPHDESHNCVEVPLASGKVLRLRMADVPMVRLITPEEYGQA